MKAIIALLSLIACTAASAPAAAPASAPTSTQPASGTRFSTRTLRVTWHGLEPEDSMYFGEAVKDSINRLAPQVLGAAVDEQSWVEVNPVVRQNSVDLMLTVNLPQDLRPAARELVDQAVKETKDAALAVFDRRLDEELKPRQEAVDIAEMRVRDAEKQAAELRDRMRTLAGRADISGKTITEALTRLEEEKQKIELDEMAKSARREELEKQIAQQSEKIQKKVEADAIAVELQKVVDARQEKADFASKQAGSGIISMTEARDTVAQLAEARAKLLERKRDAAAEAGGDVLAALSKELLTLAVDLRELSVRLDFVKQHLPGLREAMDQLDAWDRAEDELLRARKELSKASDDLHTYSRPGNGIRPPTFEVLQSADRATPPEKEGLFGGGGGGGGGGQQR